MSVRFDVESCDVEVMDDVWRRYAALLNASRAKSLIAESERSSVLPSLAVMGFLHSAKFSSPSLYHSCPITHQDSSSLLKHTTFLSSPDSPPQTLNPFQPPPFDSIQLVNSRANIQLRAKVPRRSTDHVLLTVTNTAA